MLRLVCTVVAAWLGVVLVVLAVALQRGDLRWFLPAAAGVALLLVLVLDVLNPEALVARHNLTRDGAVAVDPDYLAELSDDAVPTIVSLLGADAAVAAVGCPSPAPDGGWAAWNLGADRAAAARAEVCRG